MALFRKIIEVNGTLMSDKTLWFDILSRFIVLTVLVLISIIGIAVLLKIFRNIESKRGK